MARKRLLTLMLSAIFLLCYVGSALAAGPARRYVGSSTAKGAIYQSSYRVDAQSLTGVKSINISATLYEKGRIGTWQVVSRCSNSSQMQTCVASANYNMKPGKSYRLDFSATFQYSNGKSETITGSTSH